MSKKNYQLIALTRFAQVPPRMISALINHYPLFDDLFATDAGSLMKINGMTSNLANEIVAASDRIDEAEKFYKHTTAADIYFTNRFEADYPEQLFELHDPPSYLYYRGNLPSSKNKIATVIGCLNPSSEGIELTSVLVKKLSEAKVQLVSSLSGGISSAVHLSAKTVSGKSFAVLNCGHQQIDSDELTPLAIDIVSKGALISEYSPEQKPTADAYLMSNRLLAAMGQAVIVTEFYQDSFDVLDLLKSCSEIGKLCFILIDPNQQSLTDEKAYEKAVRFGAIPIIGLGNIDDIIKSLV